jgi:thiol-disulfide isomerase/thioredoxin
LSLGLLKGRGVLVVATLAVLLGSGYQFVAHRYFPDQGGPAPQAPEVRYGEFWGTKLPDMAGNAQPLDQWLGKVAVVNFWATWCPPCRKEIPGFIQLQDRLGAQGLQFVGVALDELDKVQAYVDETGINYPILLGDMAAVNLGQAAGNRLGGLPYTVIFDRQGKAVAALTGAISEERLEALVKPLL